jgi:hypothetical protein
MTTSWTAIASVTVGAGGTSSIDFTSIPSTYTDLVVKLSARSTLDEANGGHAVGLKINGVTTNQSYRVLSANGSSASSFNGTDNFLTFMDSSGYTANTFGNSEIYFTNYAGSNNKAISADGVSENNATAARSGLTAYLWSNSAAITSLSFFMYVGTGSIVQYSTATLYGIKNS